MSSELDGCTTTPKGHHVACTTAIAGLRTSTDLAGPEPLPVLLGGKKHACTSRLVSLDFCLVGIKHAHTLRGPWAARQLACSSLPKMFCRPTPGSCLLGGASSIHVLRSECTMQLLFGCFHPHLSLRLEVFSLGLQRSVPTIQDRMAQGLCHMVVHFVNAFVPASPVRPG